MKVVEGLMFVTFNCCFVLCCDVSMLFCVLLFLCCVVWSYLRLSLECRRGLDLWNIQLFFCFMLCCFCVVLCFVVSVLFCVVLFLCCSVLCCFCVVIFCVVWSYLRLSLDSRRGLDVWNI